MNPEGVKFPHININGSVFFLFGEFIALDERRQDFVGSVHAETDHGSRGK